MLFFMHFSLIYSKKSFGIEYIPPSPCTDSNIIAAVSLGSLYKSKVLSNECLVKLSQKYIFDIRGVIPILQVVFELVTESAPKVLP